jgi:hypothetical protein
MIPFEQTCYLLVRGKWTDVLIEQHERLVTAVSYTEFRKQERFLGS